MSSVPDEQLQHRTVEPLPRVDTPLKLLFVDDEPAQVRTMGRCLLRFGDRVALTAVDNGIDALIEVGSAHPDLVIMDVFMPGLNGVEACRRLKANPATSRTKVILTSAAMTPELEASALEAGADHAISKPIDMIQVLRAAGIEMPRRYAKGTVPIPTGAPAEAPADAPSSAVVVSAPVVPRRAANVLVDMLVDAGVEVVFGLPGGAISPVHDALLDSKIQVVTNRHESGCMFAAAGYARATGKLGVAVVTSGPGALNAMTGLASAWCDGVPVLLLVGEVPRNAQGKGVLQDGSAHGLQLIEMARYISKLAAEIPDGRQVPHLLRRAIGTALSGRRGPVVLSLPMDVTTADIMPPAITGTIKLESSIPNDTIDEIAKLIQSAAHPLILAGSGLRGSDAPALLRKLVERTGCPVATTPKGKGVFPESDPHALGVVGLGGHPSTQAYLAGGVDVLIAIGTSLGDLSTDGFSPLLQAGRAMVHVDIDARQIGKSYSPTMAVVASADVFLRAMLDRLPATTAPRAAGGGVVRHRLPASTSTSMLSPQTVIDEIQDILPADTLYTADSGEHFLFATHVLRLDDPDAFLVMSGLGSMGQSIGAALGAQLAFPGRTIAAICGDGCFAMNAFEVSTAVAADLPIRVFVFNDGCLGMVESGHEAVYGRRPSYPTRPLDVVTVAKGLGATVLRVDQPGELLAARDLLRDHAGPVVVDVRIDPSIRLPKKDRMGAFVPAVTRPADTLN